MRRRRDKHEREVWKDAVMSMYDGRCVVTGEPADDAHHVILQQHLRDRAKQLGVDPASLVWDTRNGIPVTRRVHARHHSRLEPIPRTVLPECVFGFADDYGLTWKLDRYYPVIEEAA